MHYTSFSLKALAVAACAVFFIVSSGNAVDTTGAHVFARRDGGTNVVSRLVPDGTDVATLKTVLQNIDDSSVPYDMIAPEWKTNTTYGIGSICIYNGKLYQKKTVPTSLPPPSDDPATWELASVETVRSSFHQELVQYYVPRDIYAWPHNTSETYNKGDLCFHDNLLYRCNKDNVRGTWYFEDWDNVRLADEVELKSIHSETPELGKWTISQNPNYGIPLYGLYYAPIGDRYGEAGLPSADTEVWWFDLTGAQEGIWTTATNLSATSASCVLPLEFPGFTEYVTLTGTRTITYPVIAYQLGSNADKLLQPKGDYARVGDIAAAAKSATNYTDQAIAAVNALSRAEAEAGFTEWVCIPATYNGHVLVPYYNEASEQWWLCDKNNMSASLFTPLSDPPADAVELIFADNIEVTATRTRLPTMADATLTPIYQTTFSEWVCNPSTVNGWDVVVRDNSDEIPPTWALEIFTIGEVEYLPYVADATNLFFASEGVTATRTRTSTLTGYTLGSQSDKPLQPKGEYAPATNIAKSALSSEVQTSLAKADTALQTAPVTSVNSKTGAVSLSASDVGAVPLTGAGALTVPNFTVGSRKDGSTVGENSVAEGHDIMASGDWSHAEGHGTCATGLAAHSGGHSTVAAGDVSTATGYKTFTGDSIDDTTGSVSNKHAGAFVWQGVNSSSLSSASNEWYRSHGTGTFNINPFADGGKDPAYGFYIGERSLGDRLGSVRDAASRYSEETQAALARGFTRWVVELYPEVAGGSLPAGTPSASDLVVDTVDGLPGRVAVFMFDDVYRTNVLSQVFSVGAGATRLEWNRFSNVLGVHIVASRVAVPTFADIEKRWTVITNYLAWLENFATNNNAIAYLANTRVKSVEAWQYTNSVTRSDIEAGMTEWAVTPTWPVGRVMVARISDGEDDVGMWSLFSPTATVHSSATALLPPQEAPADATCLHWPDTEWPYVLHGSNLVARLDISASRTPLPSPVFAAWYPDGDVRSAADFTQGLRFDTPDQEAGTVAVLAFCNTINTTDTSAMSGNSGLSGRVVVPPYWDDPDTGRRYTVTAVAAGSVQTYMAPALEVVLPATVTVIGDFAFAGRSGLTRISAPGVVTVGAGAFISCAGLPKVVLPCAETLGAGAFSGCSGLDCVVLPAVSSIGARALGRCATLRAVDISGHTGSAPAVDSTAFSESPCAVAVFPSDKYASWIQTSGWKACIQGGLRVIPGSQWREVHKAELLSGSVYDFSTNVGLYTAVRDLIRALGGSVVNFPEVPVQ